MHNNVDGPVYIFYTGTFFPLSQSSSHIPNTFHVQVHGFVPLNFIEHIPSIGSARDTRSEIQSLMATTGWLVAQPSPHPPQLMLWYRTFMCQRGEWVVSGHSDRDTWDDKTGVLTTIIKSSDGKSVSTKTTQLSPPPSPPLWLECADHLSMLRGWLNPYSLIPRTQDDCYSRY